jgi:hypothetical protein
MSNDDLRNKLIERIDSLLARAFLVWGDDRTLLSALRGYLAVMPDSELTRLQTFVVKAVDEAEAHGVPTPDEELVYDPRGLSATDNQRRAALILLKSRGGLTSQDQNEFNALQRRSLAALERIYSAPKDQ